MAMVAMQIFIDAWLPPVPRDKKYVENRQSYWNYFSTWFNYLSYKSDKIKWLFNVIQFS